MKRWTDWQVLSIAFCALGVGFGIGLSDNFHWSKIEYVTAPRECAR